MLNAFTLFSLGLLGAGHCAGMCGGITAALGFAADRPRALLIIAAYNLGRILGYGIMGALAGALAYLGSRHLGLAPVLRGTAGVMLILMGLYLADWWRLLTRLEQLGGHLWRRLQPLGQRLFPVRHPASALVLGLLWGWLPCGLVYTALAYTLTAPSPWQGGLQMMAFGLGTAPAMIAGGVFSGTVRDWLQRRALRRSMAMLLIGFGAWTLYIALASAAGQGHHHH